jgi:hypothetical protein
MNIKHSFDILVKKVQQIRVPQGIRILLATFALVGISAFTLHNAPVIGVYCTALAAVVLAGTALLYDPAKKIAIVGAAMLVSLMVPTSLQRTTIFAKTACLYGSLLLLCLVYRFLFMQDRAESDTKHEQVAPHGWRSYITQLPQGLVVGQFLGGFAFLLLPHTNPFRGIDIGVLLAAIAAFAMVEIMFFQSLLQPTIRELTSSKIAIIATAAFYICLSATISPQTFFVNAIAGIVFASMYFMKQNTLPVMFASATMKLVFVGLVLATTR